MSAVMGMATVSEKLDLKYVSVIGIEIHAQLSTYTKMFCGCRNIYGDPPNSHTCPVCLGLPGALPVVNNKAIELALLLGLSLGCTIAKKCRFARKNYFYPDLTKGYQISQYDEPLCQGGSIQFRTNNETKEIRFVRIHLEEDAGKSIHDGSTEDTKLDFNRCGVPLAEIVTEPELRSAKEARDFLGRLKQILEYLEISNCNLEEGNLRFDVNVSLKKKGSDRFGTRTEIKNINSLRNVEKAITAEIQRQEEILDNGGKIEQITLLWNDTTEDVDLMRGKEEAHDYRYFPDPDLVPLVIHDETIEAIRKKMIELPFVKEKRFVESYSLRTQDAEILSSNKETAEYFEALVGRGVEPKEASKWVLGEVLRYVSESSLQIENCPVQPERLSKLIQLVFAGKINLQVAKDLFRKMLTDSSDPDDIVKKENLFLVQDSSAVVSAVKVVLKNNPDELKRYYEGKQALFGFFLGEVMKVGKGQFDPKLIRTALQQELEKEKPISEK